MQNYFGAPLALIVIAAVFLPIYRRLKVYTAYEYLGHRFDPKTRLLGAGLFLLQRGLGAGITIYAPGDRALDRAWAGGWTRRSSAAGCWSSLYTVAGGSDAVSLTQKYQIGVIFAGMVAAFFVLLAKLPPGLTFSDALAVAGGFHKLNAVDFSLNADRRYTIWSGLLGGMFLALSYFGTDQSQVQRYLGGASLRESRLGLMFNAVFKIPMQFFILLLGVLIFVFYQFERPPVFFNQAAWDYQVAHGSAAALHALEQDFDAAHARGARAAPGLARGPAFRQPAAEAAARGGLPRPRTSGSRPRGRRRARPCAAADPRATANDADYVFITFILAYLPHGLIGLLVTAFFAAALSSKAGELNALGSTTTVDIYRHLVRRGRGRRPLRAARRNGSRPSGGWSRSASRCSPTWRRI